MITISKLHNDVPKPIKNMKIDTRPVKGSHLIPECNSAIFLVAKRKSGKTTALFKLIKSCIGKDTIVIIFCANLYRDKSYGAIRKWLKDHNVEWLGYTGIVEDGVNKLDELNEMLKERAEDLAKEEDEEEERVIEKPRVVCNFGDESDDDEERKPRKSKYQTPEYIIIFDDMSDQLKKTTIVDTLLKNARHFARVIISTQYIHDISVGTRSQIGYWLVFKSNNKKLPIIHSNADLSIRPEYLEAIYNKAVEQPFSFLYIDTANEEYRINFNKRINLPPEAFE